MVSMLLSGKIASSEAKYKNILENFFREIVDISFLPSHGIDHHRRVWEYAKEIRFQHFLRTYGFSGALVDKHSKRHEIISSFFDLYNQESGYYKFDNQLVSGHCGVAETIKQLLKDEQSGTRVKFHANNYPDPLIHWFFTELNYELSESFQHEV